MPANPRKVASRWLEASELQAPPAMHEAILEWVYAVTAATAIESIEGEIEQSKKGKAVWEGMADKLSQAAAALRSNPTWKNYKAFHEEKGNFTPAGRRSIRDFQKMTPEKRKTLEESLEKEIREVEEIAGYRVNGWDDQIDELRERQRKLRAYMKPGVDALASGEVEKMFPIDTTGWRYGTTAYLEKLDEALKEATRGQIRDLEDMMRRHPESKDMVQTMISMAQKKLESGDYAAGWKKIKVVLAAKPVRSEAASWSPVGHILRIVVPSNASPWQLDFLSKALRHELQHFAQGWLSALAGHSVSDLMNGIPAPGGIPGKDYLTPEFDQGMSPGYPKADAPEAKALRRRLRNQGVNLRQVNWHDLDDVEFYTELADAIDRWRVMEAGGRFDLSDPELRRLAIRIFTMTYSKEDWEKAKGGRGGYGPLYNLDQDKFFVNLNRVPGARAKKRKAVSEFVKAVL